MKFKKLLMRLLVVVSIISIAYLVFQIIKDNNEDNNIINNNEIIEKEENNNIKEEENTSNENTNNDTKVEEPTNKTEEPLKNETEENKQEKSDNVTVSIELVGDEEINLNVGDTYKEYGAKAVDSNGNDVSSKIQVDNSVDTSKKGEYTVIYSIGNSIVIRTVKVN